MIDKKLIRVKKDVAIEIRPMIADELLILDDRCNIGPAEMVESRLRRLLPTGSLPLNSSTFRKR